MKIGVMGAAGVVGAAVSKVMANGHEVTGYDPKFVADFQFWPMGEDGQWLGSHGFGAWRDFIDGVTAVFICAPTPWDEKNQRFDDGPVMDCIEQLCEHRFSGLIILKSTTLPTVVSELKECLRTWTLNAGWDIADIPSLVACPEFLNARTAYEDLRDARHIIIGGAKYDRDLCLEIHKQAQPGVQGYFLDTPEEAMMLKYMQNAFFATKNALFNQFYLACREFGWDYNAIRSGIVLDDRVHPVHTDVPGYDGKMGYGGMCLSKDVRAMESILGQAVKDHSILAKVDEFNTHLRSIGEV